MEESMVQELGEARVTWIGLPCCFVALEDCVGRQLYILRFQYGPSRVNSEESFAVPTMGVCSPQRGGDDDDKVVWIAEVTSCQQEASMPFASATPCRTYFVLATHLAAAELL